MRRVFRDEEELPASADLSREIETALEASRFLIVVCSRRTPESEWVNAEVLQFRALGRDDHILALLIDGEPADAFPQSLREIRRAVTDEQGITRVTIEEVEPLAADVRRMRTESMRYLRRMAKLRLLACILGCRFDDLRQRERERHTRRMLALGGVLTVLVLVLGALGLFGARSQKEAASQRARASAARIAEAAVQAAQYADEGNYYDAVRECEAARRLGDAPLLQLIQWHAERGRSFRAHTFSDGVGLDSATGSSVAFSPSGELLAYGTGRGTVQLRDVQTGEQMRELQGYESPVMGVKFSPDGKLLAAVPDERFGSLRPPASGPVTVLATPQSSLKIWDVSTGEVSAAVHGTPGDYQCVDFSPNGKLVAVGGGTKEKTIRVWNKETETLELVLKTQLDHEKPCVVFSPDGKCLAFQAEPGRIALVDLKRQRRMGEFHAWGEPDFSPDGQYLAASSPKGGFRVWEVGTGREVHRLGEEMQVSCLDFRPDGKCIASGSPVDETVRFWGLSTGRESLALDARMLVTSLAFSPDGVLLAVGSGESTAAILRVGMGETTRTLTGHKGRVSSIAFSPDGETLASGSEDSTIKLWSVSGASEPMTITGHRGGVTALSFSAAGEVLASSSSDKTIVLWDVVTGTRIRALRGHASETTAVSFSQDGRRLASGSSDGDVRIWDVVTGEGVTTLKGHDSALVLLAFRPDGKSLISAAAGGVAIVWDIETGRQVHTAVFEDHRGTLWPAAISQAGQWEMQLDTLESMGVSPDGTHLASGGSLGTVRIWDPATGRNELSRLATSSTAVTQVRYSATGSSSTSTKETVPVVIPWSVDQVAFRPDGSLLALGSDGPLIKFWDLEKRKVLLSLLADRSLDGPLAFSPDGRRLAAVAGKVVRVWDVDPAHNPELP